MSKTETKFDAIVVGSGISGGWAAKELTERGLNVLLLERGKNVEHIKDYVNARKGPWEYPHRGQRTYAMEEAYPVLRRDYPLNERNLDWWASDQDSPYTEVKRFDWYRGYQVGGRSLTWGRQSYRLGDLDFEANAREGIAVDWPVRYDELKPWYDHVERFAGISGSKENLPQLPDGEFQPAMPLNCGEQQAAEQLKKAFDGQRHMIPGRVANLTQPLPGRSPCQYRAACYLGCPYGAYFSSQSSTLPAAMATGKLVLRPFAIVTELNYDKDKQRVVGVRVQDAVTNNTTEYQSKIVFLCASTLNSTWLLMRSATDIWPGGLGSSSGELGHNLMDHHFRLGARGRLEGLDDRYYFGARPTGFYIPRYRNLKGDKRDYLRGFGYQGSASRGDWSRAVRELGIGAKFKDALTQPGQWSIGATAFGEMLPDHNNKISIDLTRTDKWGQPVLAIDCEIGENEKLMRKDMMNDMAETLQAAGAVDVQTYDAGYAPGQGIHEMGTARMGRDPSTSVLNRWNQVWDAPNVFVTDGSCMTSAANQNPSLTYMALTARAADYAVAELKRQNLQRPDMATSENTNSGQPNSPSRREVIRNALLLSGYTSLVGTGTLATGCATTLNRSDAVTSTAFSVDEIQWLDEVAETILPETDTPGAKAAEVGAFIAIMVTDTYSPEEQALFHAGTRALESECVATYGTGFMGATASQRLSLLERLDQEQITYTLNKPADSAPHYFHTIKQLTAFGYFTSEIGYTQALRYVESPGRFDPCVEYTPGERAWARHA